MVGEPSRCQLLPASGPEICISLFCPAKNSQYLSGIIEAALPGLGAEAAIGQIPDLQPNCGGTLPNASAHRRRIHALRRCGKARSGFMSNL